jgi:hypothetical protein
MDDLEIKAPHEAAAPDAVSDDLNELNDQLATAATQLGVKPRAQGPKKDYKAVFKRSRQLGKDIISEELMAGLPTVQHKVNLRTWDAANLFLQNVPLQDALVNKVVRYGNLLPGSELQTTLAKIDASVSAAQTLLSEQLKQAKMAIQACQAEQGDNFVRPEYQKLGMDNTWSAKTPRAAAFMRLYNLFDQVVQAGTVLEWNGARTADENDLMRKDSRDALRAVFLAVATAGALVKKRADALADKKKTERASAKAEKQSDEKPLVSVPVVE